MIPAFLSPTPLSLSTNTPTLTSRSRTTNLPRASAAAPPTTAPLLVRAAKNLPVERPPVWMMRQAGRYMKVYQELAKKYPSFRDRSEIPELSIEISLQPWKAFKPDGVILFSDILTPLPGMGIGFEIPEGGPVIDKVVTMDQVEKVGELDCEKSCGFIRQILESLKKEVDGQAAILGFVGAPYTMATYCVEGGSSKSYLGIKKMMFREPKTLHELLKRIAHNIGEYACYQIQSGADVVQMFDSWAGQLSPVDYEIFAMPYQKIVVDIIKKRYPETPVILYISGGGVLLERMKMTGVDIISVDWTVDMKEARQRLGNEIVVQGNLDPAVLLGSKDFIRERTLETIQKAGPLGHICNLGHGVYPTTPEDNVAEFFKTVQNFRW